jgi:hypothetical protein
MGTFKPRRSLRYSVEAMFLGLALLLTAIIWVNRSMNWIEQRQTMLASDAVQGHFRGSKAPNGLWLLGENAVVIIIVKDEVHISHVRRLFPEAEVRLLGAETVSGRPQHRD